MTKFGKIALGIAVGIVVVCSIVVAVAAGVIMSNSLADVQKSDSSLAVSDSVSDTLSNTDGELNADDYVTYFDLAYDAYTNPAKFVDKEITFVGYYSNSAYSEDTSSSTATSTSETSSDDASKEVTETQTYHFITMYGQVDECHITAEFTTADGKYPEVGTVIKITGKFTAYEENGNTYYTVTADSYSTIDA